MKKIIKSVPGMEVVYTVSGKAPEYVKENMKSIYQIEDETERNNQVDILISKLNEHGDEFGFFGAKDEVIINNLYHQSIKIDDNEIYHIFFNNLHDLYKNSEKMSPSNYSTAIIKTIYDYFGANFNDEQKRRQLTMGFIDDDENLVTASVKNLKGQNCAACVEFSAVSHNLWLLSGAKSNFVCNFDIQHAFNVIELKNNLLFDVAQQNFKVLNFNAIEKIENNQELVVNGFSYTEPSRSI